MRWVAQKSTLWELLACLSDLAECTLDTAEELVVFVHVFARWLTLCNHAFFSNTCLVHYVVHISGLLLPTNSTWFFIYSNPSYHPHLAPKGSPMFILQTQTPAILPLSP